MQANKSAKKVLAMIVYLWVNTIMSPPAMKSAGDNHNGIKGLITNSMESNMIPTTNTEKPISI